VRDGWHSSVGITTVCRSGVRIQVEAKFFTPSRPSLGPTVVTGSSPGVNRPGRDVNHTPSPSADVKERVELCLYFPSLLSLQVMVLECTFSVTKDSRVLF
jgi:hypothetical protein